MEIHESSHRDDDRVTSESASVYRDQVLSAVPRLLGTLNRDALSPAAGSFDRDQWAWKFRDSPIMTLQMGMAPLASLWEQEWPANPWARNQRLLSWIELAIAETLRRQGRHGGFETIGPNTWDHGVTLAIVAALASAVESLGSALEPRLRDRALDAMSRGCDFARKTSEDYAFISNHQALFALAYFRAHRLLGESRLRAAGEGCVAAIIRQQSTDGWYREYGGPDPGYETLGITYLAHCWRHTDDPALLDSLHRSVRFLAHFVHPDGSLGGGYGSRHTALYYPGGLEILADRIPVAAAIAIHMRQGVRTRNVVTLETTDPENAPTMLASYIDAGVACASRSVPPHREPLPGDALDGVVRFPDAGITVAGTPRYYAVTNASKGGVIRVFGKARKALAYEDAGYVIEEGRRRWASQLLGCGRETAGTGPHEANSLSRFARVRQTQLTPGAFLVLRFLNLTVFRSLLIGNLVRKRIISRLVTGTTMSDQFSLARSIRFLDDRVSIHDEVTARNPAGVTRLSRPRSFIGIHMGSASYFSSQDMAGIPDPGTEMMEASLRSSGQGRCAFDLVFSTDGSVTVESSSAESGGTE